ncbi:MAG: hypothetical protein ACI89L_000684 [Phycisphaerales bacterium]|jgi:hypothetical protein
MMLSWLLMIGAALMTLGLSVNAIWRAVMPPSGLPRGAGCGSCGYELTTLTAGRCSECGADLIKSGVTTRRNAVRAAGSLPAALMGWTVIMVMAWGIVFAIGASVVAMNTMNTGGGVQTVTNTQSFQPVRVDRDGDGRRERSADYELTYIFDGDSNWGAGGAQSGVVSIEIEGDDVTTPLIFEYDIETQGYTITGTDGTEIESGTGFTSKDAEGLLGQAGLDLTDPGIAEETIQAGELFQGAIDNPMNFESTGLFNTTTSAGGLSSTASIMNYGGGPMGMTGFGTSPTEYVVFGSIIVFGVLVYGVGVVFLIRRRGKLLAPPRNDRVDTAPPPPPMPTQNA